MTTQPTTQFLKLSEGTLAYDVQGSGPLIICMPAGGDIRSSYKFVVPMLTAAGYTVVTMDLRGQGDSTAVWSSYTTQTMGGDIIALIKQLNMGPALLVGNSKSAGTAVAAAAQAPELVSGIVMTGPFARSGNNILAWLTANLLLSPVWGNVLYHMYFNTMNPGTTEPGFEERREAVHTMFKDKKRLRATRRMFSDGNVELDGQLAALKIPVAILMGSKDPDFPKPEKEVAELVARLVSTTPITHMIEGAGHHVQAQSPANVSKYILELAATIKN